MPGIGGVARVPLPTGPEVGFPSRAGTAQQVGDDLGAEELDDGLGQPFLQQRRGAVADAAQAAGLAHGAAAGQHEDGDALAPGTPGNELLPVEVDPRFAVDGS